MTGFLVVRSTEATEGLGHATSHGVSRERKKGRGKGVEKVEGWAERVAPSLRLYKSPDYAWLFNERRVSRIFTARNGSSRLAGSKAGKLNISLVRFKHDSEFPSSAPHLPFDEKLSASYAVSARKPARPYTRVSSAHDLAIITRPLTTDRSKPSYKAATRTNHVKFHFRPMRKESIQIKSRNCRERIFVVLRLAFNYLDFSLHYLTAFSIKIVRILASIYNI